MVRTIVSLSGEDKNWLDNYSYAQHQSTAATIRQPIKQYRKTIDESNKAELLERTAGLWRKRQVDGLRYVMNLREDWDRNEG